jgi:hypothetical protein
VPSGPPSQRVCCYPLGAGFSFFARVRVVFGFSARRSRRSGCLAASAALAASALVGRPLAGAAGAEEAGAGVLRFAISLSSRSLMHLPSQVCQRDIGHHWLGNRPGVAAGVGGWAGDSRLHGPPASTSAASALWAMARGSGRPVLGRPACLLAPSHKPLPRLTSGRGHRLSNSIAACWIGQTAAAATKGSAVGFDCA